MAPVMACAIIGSTVVGGGLLLFLLYVVVLTLALSVLSGNAEANQAIAWIPPINRVKNANTTPIPTDSSTPASNNCSVILLVNLNKIEMPKSTTINSMSPAKTQRKNLFIRPQGAFLFI